MERIVRDVPYFEQPTSSPYCSAATAQMILAKYGRKTPLKRLVSGIGITHKHGARITDLGAWFAENGYETTIVSCTQALPAHWAYLEPEVIGKKLLAWCKRPVQNQRYVRKSATRFLMAGGRFEYRPVQWRDIAEALDRDEPPILNVTMGSYYPTRTWDAGHYVVPTEIDDNELVFHDPIMGPNVKLPRERALYVCHVRHGGAIFVRPKKKKK